jgi:ferredoxin-thioredoxin reductase catalytic subunit
MVSRERVMVSQSSGYGVTSCPHRMWKGMVSRERVMVSQSSGYGVTSCPHRMWKGMVASSNLGSSMAILFSES